MFGKNCAIFGTNDKFTKNFNDITVPGQQIFPLPLQQYI